MLGAKKHGCPSWSKGCDLRSHGESLVGSNPTPSILCSVSSVGQSVRLLTARSEVRPLLGATRLAQSVERRTFNPVVVGSSPTSGA